MVPKNIVNFKPKYIIFTQNIFFLIAQILKQTYDSLINVTD